MPGNYYTEVEYETLVFWSGNIPLIFLSVITLGLASFIAILVIDVKFVGNEIVPTEAFKMLMTTIGAILVILAMVSITIGWTRADEVGGRNDARVIEGIEKAWPSKATDNARVGNILKKESYSNKPTLFVVKPIAGPECQAEMQNSDKDNTRRIYLKCGDTYQTVEKE